MKKQPLYDSAAMAARPLESFLHDSNAHDDMKIKRVRFRLGKEGVCTFWLRSSGAHRRPHSFLQKRRRHTDAYGLSLVSKFRGSGEEPFLFC